MNMLDPRYRKIIVNEIKKGENKYRKDRSWKQYRVMTNDYSQYVAEKLAGHLDPDTVIEMPKIASINVAEKLTNKTAVVYKQAPKRTYTNATDEDSEVFSKIHEHGHFNEKLRASNKAYKYQNQNLIQIVPKRGKLCLKSLKMHQFDVIPMDDDPEEFKTIIISVNERQLIDQEQYFVDQPATGIRGASEVNSETRNYTNEKIADEDDYKASLERFVVWDLETQTNFVMNGSGKIKDPEFGDFVNEVTEELLKKITSPFIEITGMLPFIDVAKDKDHTFFVRNHHSVTDFTIEFNAALSDYADTNHMQSKSQAIIKGPADMLAKEIVIGSHVVLKLIKQFDEQGREIDMDFQYVNPSPDMQGAKDFIESLLALYLSSRDVDVNEITTQPGADRYSSGFERFLSIFETFSASQEDFDVYKEVEKKKFEIIKGWIAVARDAQGVLDPEYIPSGNIEEVDESVDFNRPEEVKTTMERLQEIEKEIELGLTSKVKALAKYKGISEEQARDMIEEIDQEEGLGMVQTQVQT